VYAESHTPLSSLNFITAHDGYTMRDLVTYQMKHNYENGEMNNDGNNHNDSWNCGAEGPTMNPNIAALREKQIRNFFLALFLSQGIPMLLMGDEYGHSRRGNNNPFVQDNDLNWFLWHVLEKNRKIFHFVSSLIAFRKTHHSLRRKRFLTDQDIQWHGMTPNHPNWSDESRFLAFTLKGTPSLYVAFNAYNHPVNITLPHGAKWRQIVRTDEDWDAHYFHLLEKAPFIPEQIELPSHTALLSYCK
jgi:isoamylase/glycogen operon protein